MSETIDGQLDPELTLVRGRTYTFNVNVASVHPFYITTQAVTGAGSQWADGVTGNGVTVGALTFAVPANAPATLFYQCSTHLAMSGTIRIVNAPPVPALSHASLAALALGLCALGGWRLTTRSARRARR